MVLLFEDRSVHHSDFYSDNPTGYGVLNIPVVPEEHGFEWQDLEVEYFVAYYFDSQSSDYFC